ncbi:hypothetical protein [Okeania sp. KiyG1]|uniref:hypothetical protein n=1 Tax=Okeania sp. KiyG1 TaxID=2720165 RepID=UPI0019239095|nr:hypothetical protein [Okeania sp. KiyG1]GGA14760.1 hypothetical protein CYANOKiyG1_28490 [Okeania sp. KiyG1]
MNLKKITQKCGKTGAITFLTLTALTGAALANDPPAPNYEQIADTAEDAVVSVGGLALVAFGASITPFVARIAMLSISKAFTAV